MCKICLIQHATGNLVAFYDARHIYRACGSYFKTSKYRYMYMYMIKLSNLWRLGVEQIKTCCLVVVYHCIIFCNIRYINIYTFHIQEGIDLQIKKILNVGQSLIYYNQCWKLLVTCSMPFKVNDQIVMDRTKYGVPHS